MKDRHQNLSTSHTGKRLDDLTSLRFIAVAMIVVFHCQGQFRVSKRVDVAKVYNNPAFENAGYSLASDISALPVDRYAIWIIQVEQGKATVCDTKKTMNIK